MLQRLSRGLSPDSVVSGPVGSQKDQRYLSMAELTGIRVGKPAIETEMRSWLSAPVYLKP